MLNIPVGIVHSSASKALLVYAFIMYAVKFLKDTVIENNLKTFSCYPFYLELL